MGEQEIIFLLLKFPRQWPLVYLIEAMYMIGNGFTYIVGKAAL
jgi:hypothetical protein